MRALVVLLLLLAWAGEARAHGATVLPPPEPPPPPPMKGPPTGYVPPGRRTPQDPDPEPKKPTTPPPGQTPKGPHETPSADPPAGPVTPSPNPDPRPVRPTRNRGLSAVDQGWRVWWEMNRTDLVGLRHLLHASGPVTGAKAPAAKADPFGGYRPTILATLRALAGGHGERLVRASAVIALGRIGGDEDARLFLGLLDDPRQPSDVHEAAALALGLLPPIKDDATRAAVRRHYERIFDGSLRLPTRAGELAVVAAGLRARDDRTLVMQLAARTVAGARSPDEAAALALACGLSGDRMLYPELREAALRGKLGGQKLNDVGRSHAVQALALLDEPAAISDLLRLVHSRKAGLHVRRSAVLGLGRVLQDEKLEPATRARIGKILVPLFTKNGDVVLRAFAMLAAGGANPPLGVGELMYAVDRGGNAELKPYGALALGLAARGREDKTARRIRVFLADELGKTNQMELRSALCIAVGLSGAKRAEKDLFDLVRDSSTTAVVRGAAAQGLGLMGGVAEPVQQAIVEALEKGPRDLLGDAALALGLLGRRTTAPLLVKLLSSAESSSQQGRIMLALGHLGHAEATAPLLRLLESSNEKPAVREFAAVALGLMGDSRPRDTLFAIDAGFNYFATTTTTNELIRLY